MTALPLDAERRTRLRLVPRDEHMGRMEAIVAAVEAEMGPRRPFAPTRERPCPEMRARGVYMADFRIGGNPVLQAIDERGELVGWAFWTPDKALEQVEAEMWELLSVRTALR